MSTARTIILTKALQHSGAESAHSRPAAPSGGLENQNNRITAGSLTVDTQERNVYKDGKPVELTAREFDLVELLIRNPNRVYSRENL